MWDLAIDWEACIEIYFSCGSSRFLSSLSESLEVFLSFHHGEGDVEGRCGGAADEGDEGHEGCEREQEGNEGHEGREREREGDEGDEGHEGREREREGHEGDEGHEVS